MKPKVDIIKCGRERLLEITEIEKECIPDGWSLKGFEDWLKNDNTVIFAAAVNEKIIGFANGTWVLDEGELLNIAVSENFRRNGTAQLLYNTLEDYFVQKGVASVFLEVREKNTSAIAFYEKNKFIKNGFRKNYYKNPCDNGVLMMKKICTPLKGKRQNGDQNAYTWN